MTRKISAEFMREVMATEQARQNSLKLAADKAGNTVASAVASALSEFCGYISRDMAELAVGPATIRDKQSGELSAAYREQVKDK